MIATMQQSRDLAHAGVLIEAVLRTAGRHTLDQLSSVAGLNWAQAFEVIDRLSRQGIVRLRRVGNDYEISLREES